MSCILRFSILRFTSLYELFMSTPNLSVKYYIFMSYFGFFSKEHQSYHKFDMISQQIDISIYNFKRTFRNCQ